MSTYVYAHFPKLVITKAVVVMYMIAVLVPEVRFIRNVEILQE